MFNLKDYVVSLGLSGDLYKKFGMQKATYYWVSDGTLINENDTRYVVKYSELDVYPAYTLQEALELLPEYGETFAFDRMIKQRGLWHIIYELDGKQIVFSDENPCNTVAKMLLMLRNQNIKMKEV